MCRPQNYIIATLINIFKLYQLKINKRKNKPTYLTLKQKYSGVTKVWLLKT